MRLLTLLFLLCLAGGLAAQDTQTIIQRNHYPAERFEAAVESMETLGPLYRQYGVTTPMTMWVFDDNTIEAVWDVASTGGFDLIGDEYAAAKMRIGEERMNELRVPPSNQEFWIGGEVDELSYVPEGTDLSEMGFIHVIRARIKTDDMEEFYRVAAEEAELAKKQNRQTPFYLEMFPVGLGTRVFEVVEFGKDRADWERREAASRAHYNSKEYKAWEKKRDAVAEVISTRTAVRNDAMSIPKPEEAAPETSYLLVDELQIADGKLNDVLGYFEDYNEMAEKHYYPQASHFATTNDDRTLMNFISLKSMADLELLNARNRQMGHAPAEDLARVRRSDKGLFTGYQRYLLELQKKYTHEPTDIVAFAPDRPMPYTMTVYEYAYGKGDAVRELLGEIKAAYTAADSPIFYNVYTYALGGPSNQFYVVTFGQDAADLRRRVGDGNAALGEDGVALQERMDKLTSVVRRVSGVTHFDKRYVPRTASN